VVIRLDGRDKYLLDKIRRENLVQLSRVADAKRLERMQAQGLVARDQATRFLYLTDAGKAIVDPPSQTDV
jgi:hypothetical protein